MTVLTPQRVASRGRTERVDEPVPGWYFRAILNKGEGLPAGSSTPGGTPPTWESGGPFGDAILFDDDGDRIIFTGLDDFVTAEGGSIALWFRHSTNNTSNWWVELTDPGNGRFTIYPYSGEFVWFGINDGGWHTFRYSPIIPDTDFTWHHLVGTWEDGTPTVAIYLDGELLSEIVDNAEGGGNDLPTGMNKVTIGGNDREPQGYNGAIQDVRVYERVLTASEVSSIYRLGSGVQE